jgi:hypothetical protein
MPMNVSSATNAAMQALQSLSSPEESTKQQFQVALLKKSLDSQQAQAAELLKLLEGKGATIDLRV